MYCSSFAPTNFQLINNTKLHFVAECNLFPDFMEHYYIYVSNGILFFQRTEIFFKSLAYLRTALGITKVCVTFMCEAIPFKTIFNRKRSAKKKIFLSGNVEILSVFVKETLSGITLKKNKKL